MSMRYYISTEEASFFLNNRMGYANSIPSSGTYKVGDFIISSTQEDGIFGWVCTVSGTPGEWEVIGSGMGNGSGTNAPVVGYINAVSFSDTRSSIEIGIDEYVKGKDFLEVHYNGLMLAEGVHYNVSENGKSINAIDGTWNANANDTQQMIFRVIKSESIKVKELKNTINIDSACHEVEMGIAGYIPGKDLVEVHLNGVLLVQGLDYEITEGKISKIDKSEAWNPYNVSGQKMFVRIFRNIANVIEPDDGSVTMEKLSPDVKSNITAIDDLVSSMGIQNSAISGLNNRVTALENAEDIDISGKQDVTDNKLATSNKTIVGAINELFQSANNGKELIANAIGEPLSSNDTFSAMREEIEELLDYFRDKLRSIGVTESLDNLKLKELIDKVRGITKYSITKKLTNCTINNNTTIIEENSSYNATITANSNYIMKSISVTMGGVDVTNNVVAGYNINIASVTGDITISANAEVNNPYPPGTNVNNTISSFSAYQYNPVTKSIPVEADGNYLLSFDYGPNISNQNYTASVTVRVVNAEGSTVDSSNATAKYSTTFYKDLTLKKGYKIEITASISATTHSSHCNQVNDIELIFNSI